MPVLYLDRLVENVIIVVILRSLVVGSRVWLGMVAGWIRCRIDREPAGAGGAIKSVFVKVSVSKGNKGFALGACQRERDGSR